jgi:hypothetical protein
MPRRSRSKIRERNNRGQHQRHKSRRGERLLSKFKIGETIIEMVADMEQFDKLSGRRAYPRIVSPKVENACLNCWVIIPRSERYCPDCKAKVAAGSPVDSFGRLMNEPIPERRRDAIRIL